MDRLTSMRKEKAPVAGRDERHGAEDGFWRKLVLVGDLRGYSAKMGAKPRNALMWNRSSLQVSGCQRVGGGGVTILLGHASCLE